MRRRGFDVAADGPLVLLHERLFTASDSLHVGPAKLLVLCLPTTRHPVKAISDLDVASDHLGVVEIMSPLHIGAVQRHLGHDDVDVVAPGVAVARDEVVTSPVAEMPGYTAGVLQPVLVAVMATLGSGYLDLHEPIIDVRPERYDCPQIGHRLRHSPPEHGASKDDGAFLVHLVVKPMPETDDDDQLPIRACWTHIHTPCSRLTLS